jgi:hypothetical protein
MLPWVTVITMAFLISTSPCAAELEACPKAAAWASTTATQTSRNADFSMDLI